MLADTNQKAKDALRIYTSLFWKPRYSTAAKADPFKTRYFHIQAAPGGKLSPLISKNPNLFRNIIHKVVQPGDFYKVSIISSSIISPDLCMIYANNKSISMFLKFLFVVQCGKANNCARMATGVAVRADRARNTTCIVVVTVRGAADDMGA